LQRLNHIRRAARISKELKSLPDSLNELYQLIVDECFKNRSTEQEEALKTMFSWLTHAMETLTLANMRFLLQSAEQEGVIDISDEISTRLST